MGETQPVILVDLNVVLDVVQKRSPHYHASSAVLDEVVHGKSSAAVAAHAVTTIHYIVGRYNDVETADKVVDWVLRYFSVAPVGRAEFVRARALSWSDFEDAVVAAAAESMGCSAIVTRNVKDFGKSPVNALTPEHYLLRT